MLEVYSVDKRGHHHYDECFPDVVDSLGNLYALVVDIELCAMESMLSRSSGGSRGTLLGQCRV